MIRPLTELTVKRLEQIFDPPGLPLVSKTHDKLATTSILIRGGPGSGKTTLAVALGHAIASAGGGQLVYFTTEISPAEIRFKSDFLRIFDSGAGLIPFPSPTERASLLPARPGSIFIQHFSGTPAADIKAPIASHGKKLSILTAAWDLLDIADAAPPPDLAGHPVRALVIDAFVLPDHGRDDSELRADLGNFIQTLEFAGITPIIIEETTTTAPSWLSFVVDLVFQLTHQDDPQRGPERGQLERTLTCTKSRYGFVSAGPHVYALSDRSPALFPALRHAANLPKIPNPLRFVLHPNSTPRVIVGGLLINADARAMFDTFHNIGGFRPIHVSLDYPFKILNSEGKQLVLGESHDPTMLTWRILDTAAQYQANTILIKDAERLLRREPWPQAIEQILLLLRSLGFIAILVGDTERNKDVGPIFDLNIKPADTNGVAGVGYDHLTYHPPFYQHTTLPPRIEPFFEGIRWSARSQRTDDKFHSLVARIGENRGRAPHVATNAFTELYNPKENSFRNFDLSHTVESTLAHAFYAGNIAALDAAEESILESIDGNSELLASLLKARLQHQGVEAAERSADRIFSTNAAAERWRGMMPWLRERVLCELRLERGDPAALDDGIRRLHHLLDTAPLPLLHRFEVSFNLALAHHRRGDHEEAARALDLALELNPHYPTALDLKKALTNPSGAPTSTAATRSRAR